MEFLFCLYLVLLLLRPQEWTPALRQLPILQALLLVCALLWLFRGRKPWSLAQFPLLGWFVLATVLSAAAIGWMGSLQPAYASMGPILIMFLILSSVAQELTVLRQIMRLCVVCACIMVLHGSLQLRNGVGWTGTEPMLGRITYVGILDDPNDLGQLFVICVAFCFYLRKQAGSMAGIGYLLAIAWICYGIVLTDSRGTMLGALAVFALVAARRYGKVALGVLGAATLPALALHTRFGEISAQEESASGRVDSWYQGFQMFLGHPLTGVGLGQYVNNNYLTAHNSIVLPMAELGLIGFIPWFGIVAVTARMLYWLAFNTQAPADSSTDPAELAAEREAGYGLLVANAGFAVSAFFLSTSYKHIFFLMVGLAVARFYRGRQVFAAPPAMTLSQAIPWVVASAGCAIAGMWLLTHVLL